MMDELEKIRRRKLEELVSRLNVKKVTIENVMDALRRCYDPEIPVNIVDLGLVYDVKIEDADVRVKMTLTAPSCPAHAFIAHNVKGELQKVEGVKRADVEVVWDPPWTPERMSADARRQLGFV